MPLTIMAPPVGGTEMVVPEMVVRAPGMSVWPATMIPPFGASDA